MSFILEKIYSLCSGVMYSCIHESYIHQDTHPPLTARTMEQSKIFLDSQCWYLLKCVEMCQFRFRTVLLYGSVYLWNRVLLLQNGCPQVADHSVHSCFGIPSTNGPTMLSGVGGGVGRDGVKFSGGGMGWGGHGGGGSGTDGIHSVLFLHYTAFLALSLLKSPSSLPQEESPIRSKDQMGLKGTKLALYIKLIALLWQKRSEQC